jgi:flagella basal body P-ring formation protein FlgA
MKRLLADAVWRCTPLLAALPLAVGPMHAAAGELNEEQLMLARGGEQVALTRLVTGLSAEAQSDCRRATVDRHLMPQSAQGPVLTQAGAELALRACLGNPRARIRWSGPRQILVAWPMHDVTASTLKAAVTEAVIDRLGTRDLELLVELERSFAAFKVAGDKLEIRPRQMANMRGLIPAHVLLQMDVFVDGQLVRTVAASVRLHAPRDVWLASKPLARGAKLEDKDFRVEAIDIAGLKTLPWQASCCEGLRLARPLEKGQMLTRDMATSSVDVADGELVTLQAHAGLVSIASAARALQSGNAGDLLMVRPVGSPQIVYARVLEHGVLEAR